MKNLTLDLVKKQSTLVDLFAEVQQLLWETNSVDPNSPSAPSLFAQADKVQALLNAVKKELS
jgi:hypothetical protein